MRGFDRRRAAGSGAIFLSIDYVIEIEGFKVSELLERVLTFPRDRGGLVY